MGVIEDALRKVKLMKASINKGIQTSIQQNDNILIDQQTEQFDEGKDSMGVSFVPSYSAFTIGLKQAAGQPHNRVTLKDTGDFYAGITVNANRTNFEIKPNIPYFGNLLEIYKANTILGIQPEAMKDFLTDYSLPEIENNFNQILSK